MDRGAWRAKVLGAAKSQTRLSDSAQLPLVVKSLPANAGDVRDAGSVPGWGRPLEEGTATHSRTPAGRIPWTEEPGGLQSMGSHRV